MPKNLGLSSPVYEIPFDDNTLIVVGRIALMWGQIIHHLDSILKLLLKQTDNEAAQYETKSVGRKLSDLSRELSKPANAKHRKLLQEVYQKVDQLASDRNVVFHGLWGRLWPKDGSDVWRVAAKSWSREAPFYADDLKALHERMTGAAEALDDAWYGLGIATGQQPKNRNRQQLWIPKNLGYRPKQPPRIVR